jgi:hypothetical protein
MSLRLFMKYELRMEVRPRDLAPVVNELRSVGWRGVRRGGQGHHGLCVEDRCSMPDLDLDVKFSKQKGREP